MLFTQQLGRAPKVAIFVALALTLLIVVHLSSFPSLAKWKLPISYGQPKSEEASQETPQKASEQPSPDLVHGSHRQPPNTHHKTAHNESTVPCQSLKGGQDVLVVMRTGATEIKDKLPAHLNTTVRV